MSQVDEIKRRIYFHDTDSGGVVYHANYFKYGEEGRMEYFNERNLNIFHIEKEFDCRFVTVNSVINWRASAFVNDLLTVKTRINEIRRSSTEFEHIIERDGKLLSDILITLVCIDSNHKVMKVPDEIRSALL